MTIFHSEDYLKKFKITNYDSYEYVKDLECPECHTGSELPFSSCKKQSLLVGWAETPQGFMMISECPECGTRYRYHGVTTERYDYYSFLENFSLRLYLQEKQ